MKASFVGDTPAEEGLAERLAETLDRLGRAVGLSHCTLGVMLTDDEGIRHYNARFRNVDQPTDVLSFPSEADMDDSESGHYLGDLIVSVERAAVQAEEHGHGLAEEMEVLILHGVLHLQGHDHETDDGRMREVEARLARELFGSTRGLIERTEDDDSEGDGGTGE